MVQNDKKFCLSCFLSQELYIISLSVMLHMCKMIISPGVFFSFSKFWFFGFLGVKGQKTVQNDKKFCQLLFISKGPYIIWLSFLVDICKIIISSGVVHFSKSFIFWDHRVGAKNCPEWEKTLSVALHISGIIIIWLSFMVRVCKIIISRCFFQF